MNPIEGVPHALIGDVPRKTAGYAGRTIGEADAKLIAPRQGSLKEGLRRNRELRLILSKVWICSQRIEGLRKALSTSDHKERNLIQVDALVNVSCRVAHVAHFHSALAGKLALNGEIPRIVRAWFPLRVLHLRVGNKRNVGARHEGIARNNWGSHTGENRGQRDGAAVGPDPHCRVWSSPAVPLAGLSRVGVTKYGRKGRQTQETLPKTHRLEGINGRLHSIQAVVEMPIPSAKHRLPSAEKPPQHPAAKVWLPGCRHARLHVVAHESERVRASSIADGREPDRGIENLAGQRSLLPLLQVAPRVHDATSCAREDRYHELALVFDRRHGRCPGQTVVQRKRGPQMPGVLDIKSSLIVPDCVLEISPLRQ